jgi:levansucrase
MSTDWTATHVAAIAGDISVAPATDAAQIISFTDDIDIWDAWPIQYRDGLPLELIDGTQLWMALAAPRSTHADARHDRARIHLLHLRADGWHDVGPAMPDDFSPGSREWSGSAIRDEASGTVILYFTAVGRRGENSLSHEQRLFSAQADLTPAGLLDNWRDLHEMVVRDPGHYMSTLVPGGDGALKAFRDPSYFRDAADGRHYMFFAGSAAHSPFAHNGVIGVATAAAQRPDDWLLLRPLILAEGVNNELERPHVVRYDGCYYLFWSTQQHGFNPDGPTGPSGLYGMSAPALSGPWRPINDSGLVFANPAQAQACSWLVLPDLRVVSFVNDRDNGVNDRIGGTFAPFLRLWLRDDRGGLET